MERPLAGLLKPRQETAMHVLLINPNTNATTTAMMLAIARAQAPADWRWSTLTAARGAALIDNPEALAVAAEEVAAMAPQIAAMAVDAVIVAAFGDPGLPALRDALDVPVIGIGESAMRAADALGLPFSVLTITPKLRESTLAQLKRYGCDRHFVSLVITASATASANDPAALVERIKGSIHRAIHDDGAQALVIGGGPVAAAAQALGQSGVALGAVVIQPLPAAVARVRDLLVSGEKNDLVSSSFPSHPTP